MCSVRFYKKTQNIDISSKGPWSEIGQKVRLKSKGQNLSVTSLAADILTNFQFPLWEGPV